jgi:NADPH-dependent 2,4-dienoyl-CoA reductase/sulfur reductase-like enzyme
VTTSGGIVIVGGGLSASRTAEQLRRAEYAGAITIVSDEDHLPYDRPPLSKEVLRAETDDVALKPAEWYAEKDVTVLLGSGATALDTAAQTVTLANGEVIGYDELVIATGLVPKWIPSFPDLEGIRVLRTYGESLALRKHADSAKHAVVVGAGFIGCEVAASLRQLGVPVTLVEPQASPLASVLGTQIGDLVTRLHRAEGVDVRCGIGVTGVSGTDHVEKVTLSDGTELDADIVVVGIGSRPSTDWLQGSGIEVDNGVVCDAGGRTSAPNVWAIGDVASWRDASGHQVRVEHWSNVAEQARVVVPAMLGTDAPSGVVVPYFWSDQYDVKIQCLGEPEADDIVHLVEDDGRKFLAYYERDGVVVGVVGGGMPGKVMKARGKIAGGAPISDVLPAPHGG